MLWLKVALRDAAVAIGFAMVAAGIYALLDWAVHGARPW